MLGLNNVCYVIQGAVLPNSFDIHTFLSFTNDIYIKIVTNGRVISNNACKLEGELGRANKTSLSKRDRQLF